MKTICIIQARLSSNRLPRKVLKEINGESIIEIVKKRVEKAKRIDEIIFAIPEEDIELEKYLKNKKIKYFKGSEEDVLNRYYECSKKYNGQFIVRVTCDCPMIDWKTIDEIIKVGIEEKVDYIVKEQMPIGLTAEAFTFDALEKAEFNAIENYQREHVISYFLDNEEKFKIKKINAEGIENNPKIRLTLDTEEDFIVIKKIYENVSIENEIEKIIEYTLKNRMILDVNKEIKQKSYKDFR